MTIRQFLHWPDTFQDVLDGRLTFQIRPEGYGVKVGDKVRLVEVGREKNPPERTGRAAIVDVVYRVGDTGLVKGFCAFGIANVVEDKMGESG